VYQNIKLNSSASACVVVVVVVVFIDFYYKVTETFIAIEDLSVLKEEELEGNITREI
jgi:hypothetical protein